MLYDVHCEKCDAYYEHGDYDTETEPRYCAYCGTEQEFLEIFYQL